MPATIGRYQLLELIGTGTLGSLHRARDLQKGRTVALRVLDGAGLSPDDIAAVRAAAVRLVDLSHPAIASLYECVDDADGVALASEFVPGQSDEVFFNPTPQLRHGYRVKVRRRARGDRRQTPERGPRSPCQRRKESAGRVAAAVVDRAPP